MHMQWITRLSQPAADITERFFVSLLEDIEVIRGYLEDKVETWWTGLSQLGMTLGRYVARIVLTGTRG